MRAAGYLALAFCVAAAVLPGWGYWQARSNGWLDIGVHDLAKRTDRVLYGDVPRADIAIRDAARAIIGEGFIEPPGGYIRWKFPGHEACRATETAMPATEADRARWRECVPVFLAWHKRVGDAARFIDARWEGCEAKNIPLVLKANAGDWMTWWIPLPHAGGTPLTTFSGRLLLDSRDCGARADGG